MACEKDASHQAASGSQRIWCQVVEQSPPEFWERYAKLEGPFLYSKESYNNFLILIQTEKLGELTKARQAQGQL